MLPRLRARGWQSQAAPCAKLTLSRPNPPLSTDLWRPVPTRGQSARLQPAAPLPPGRRPAEALLYRQPVALRSSPQSNTAAPAAAALPARAATLYRSPPGATQYRARPRSTTILRSHSAPPVRAQSSMLPAQAARRPDTPASTGSCQSLFLSAAAPPKRSPAAPPPLPRSHGREKVRANNAKLSTADSTSAVIRQAHPDSAALSEGTANSRSCRRTVNTNLVPHPANRANQGWREAVVHLAPQVVDIHIHHVRRGIEGQVPHVFDDHRPRQPAPGIAHQVFQQREFLGRQFNVTPGALHFTLHAIQTEIADGENRFRWQVAAPQQRPRPRRKFEK